MSDLFGGEKIFNGVLNGKDVFRARVVDTVDHRGERGGLAPAPLAQRRGRTFVRAGRPQVSRGDSAGERGCRAA